MRILRWIVRAACFSALAISIGCSGKQAELPTADAQANAKLTAMKKLADAMAQDANGAEARGELENFRNTPLDAQKNPQQADEIAEVYRQRIQGKYKTPLAQEIQQEVAPYLSRSKPTK